MEVLAKLTHCVFLNVDGTHGWAKLGRDESHFDPNGHFVEQVSDHVEAYIWTLRATWYVGRSLEKAKGAGESLCGTIYVTCT